MQSLPTSLEFGLPVWMGQLIRQTLRTTCSSILRRLCSQGVRPPCGTRAHSRAPRVRHSYWPEFFSQAPLFLLHIQSGRSCVIGSLDENRQYTEPEIDWPQERRSSHGKQFPQRLFDSLALERATDYVLRGERGIVIHFRRCVLNLRPCRCTVARN